MFEGVSLWVGGWWARRREGMWRMRDMSIYDL